MEFDLKVAQDFVGYINDVKEIINQNKDLVNSERLREVEKVEKEFSQATEDAQSENRKLRIGVIGDVKAGKSSFLNALFFNGEDILPKACTPMTAALTKNRTQVSTFMFRMIGMIFLPVPWSMISGSMKRTINMSRKLKQRIIRHYAKRLLQI